MTHALAAPETGTALSRLLMDETTGASIRRRLGTEFLPLADFWRRTLTAPLRQLAERGGKEFRSRLLEIGWEMAGRGQHVPDELTALVEGLHLGSLVVDDIEDGSTTRRGGPSLHEFCGLPVALNAANWLYFWSPELLARLELPAGVEIELRRAVNDAVLRAHYGQALDLSVRVTELRHHEVPAAANAISRLKTGALMELAAHLGAAAGLADRNLVDTMMELGQNVGVALQMLDDLTSVTAESRASKGCEDICQGRTTWPWAWLAMSDALGYARLRQQYRDMLSDKSDPHVIIQQLRSRVSDIGRFEVNQKLSVALRACERRVGRPAGFEHLVDWIDKLKHYPG